MNTRNFTSKEPLRRCLGLAKSFPKKDLIRLVKISDKIVIDLSGKMKGRGAYLSKNIVALQNIIKRKSLEKEFKVSVDLTLYMELEALING
ncbi:MAG: YlxR family protein [Bacillales bacterium]|jgi:predicted RNA-binding protein YlxR (DUF448 family)|nr:YlxR family protein [Bacillales bacterium]